MATPWTLRLDLDLRSSLGQRLHPDAVIVQEDRNLVMGPQSILDLDAENDVDALNVAGDNQRPLPLGEVRVRRGRDNGDWWTYQAVVHDFDLEPSCRPGDVRRCLCFATRDASDRGFRHLASEPLGCWRSRGLSLGEMVVAVDDAVVELCSSLERPIKVTVLLSDLGEVEEASNLLRARLLGRARRSFRTVDGDAAVLELREGQVRFHARFVPGTLSGYLIHRVGAEP
jgi:hypothetical protein